MFILWAFSHSVPIPNKASKRTDRILWPFLRTTNKQFLPSYWADMIRNCKGKDFVSQFETWVKLRRQLSCPSFLQSVWDLHQKRCEQLTKKSQENTFSRLFSVPWGPASDWKTMSVSCTALTREEEARCDACYCIREAQKKGRIWY